MKKLLTILFSVSILSLAACEDPGEDLLKKDDTAQVDNTQKGGSDFYQTTD